MNDIDRDALRANQVETVGKAERGEAHWQSAIKGQAKRVTYQSLLCASAGYPATLANPLQKRLRYRH